MPKKVDFVRQNALDLYDRDYCEYLILRLLELHNKRSKDFLYLFYMYYVSISQADVDEESFSKLIDAHGFKISLVTDSNNSKSIMEVYTPILKSKADDKIMLNDKKNTKY